ncbi:MAG: sugar MFS transporter [Bacteroidetes bacterium]|nr:sugar MFS transporter [Bacteroidota bacterium]
MPQSTSKQGYGLAIFLIGCLFFIFGFITWSNSQLIPYFKIACQLSQSESYLVATAFFAAYFVMALPSSYILNKTGYKKGMSLGLFIMAIGALLFLPAAGKRSYPLFLAGLFIIGTGLALLQTAANPYVAELGPHESAAQRISIMGICNKLAGIIAVYAFGSIVLSNADALIARLAMLAPPEKESELAQLAQRVVMPYGIMSAVLVVLGIALLFTGLPEINEREEEDDTSLSAHKKNVLQFPHLVLGAIAIFLYVGAEVISYDTFAGFGQYLGYPLDQAKHFASFTGYGLLAGYLVGIVAIPRFISQQKALLYFTLLSLFLVLLTLSLHGHAAVLTFAALGFSNSVMWPAIFPLALKGLGRFTKTGAALLIMGIVGGAVLPPLYGKLAEGMGSLAHPQTQAAYVILLPCYLFILYYALWGRKPR